MKHVNGAQPRGRLSETPCPKCGCHILQKFECDCGVCKEDYCDNCGRWASLKPSQHITLSEVDVRCTLGKSEHRHSETEKCAQIDRFFSKAKPS